MDKANNSSSSSLTTGQKRIQELRKAYSSSQEEKKKAKILLYGDWGTFKTSIACSMPGNILFYTFDPGGDKVYHIQEGVKKGRVLVDNTFQERQMDGSGDTFNKWNQNYKQLKRQGVFDEIDTVVLDSLTTFQRNVIDASIASNQKQGIIGPKMPIRVPHRRDYGVQQSAIEYAISDLLSLPCHVVIIAHAEEGTDENERPYFQPLITGSKLRKSLPLLFDEIYITYFLGKKSYLRLESQGIYKSRSRLYGLSNKLKPVYETTDPTQFSLSKDILEPTGYCSKDEIVTLSPLRSTELN